MKNKDAGKSDLPEVEGIEWVIPEKKKNYRKVMAVLLILFSIGLGILAATFNGVIAAFNKNSDKKISLNSIKGIQNAVDDLKEITSPLDKKMNIMVLGSDISYDGRGHADKSSPTRSDTIMLAQIDPEKKLVNILSVPRDSRVIIHGRRYHDKINADFAYGGEKLARQTLEDLAGIPVQNYVALKLNGLVNIVDILGGVDINVEKDMHYVDHTAKLDIDIHKGWQHLDGKEAHHYVRFRHDDLGDIGRVQRQQRFIDAVAAKLLNPSIIVKLPRLVDEVQKNIITDLSSTEMLRVGYFLRKLKREQIKLVMLPGSFAMIGGVSYWAIDEYTAKVVITDLFPDSTYAQKSIDTNAVQDPKAVLRERRRYRIAIKNATSNPLLLTKASELLKVNGWNVMSLDQGDDIKEKTQIILQTGITKQVSALTESIGVPAEVIKASIGDIYSDYTIVLGKDFEDYIKRKKEINP